jgi:translation initiation factor IF-2
MEFRLSVEAIQHIKAHQEKKTKINDTLHVHTYYHGEGANHDITRSLNPDFIEEIAKRGWTIEKNIGRGSSSDVFTISDNNNKKAALLLFSNERITEERQLQLKKMDVYITRKDLIKDLHINIVDIIKIQRLELDQEFLVYLYVYMNTLKKQTSKSK